MQDRTESSDGWVVGAWSTEGWMSATAPPPPPPVDDAEESGSPEHGPVEPGSGEPESVEPGADDDRVDGTGTGDDEPPSAEAVAEFDDDTGPIAQDLPGPVLATSPVVDDETIENDVSTIPGLRSVEPHAAPRPPFNRFGPPRPGPVGPPPAPACTPVPAPAPPRVQHRPRPEVSSAAELTEDAIVRFRSDRPQSGWRGALFKASAGLVNPGVGPVERARQEQLRRIRRPLPGSHQVAVTSIKGGVGKTSVTACLGLVLAENRGDRVIALDANPDAGTLADRLTSEISVTVRNLIDNIGATHSLTDVARYTSLAGRLQVLASEQDPAMSEAFNRDEYERVCAVLTRFYNIVITDSGTGLVHSAMEGTLALADSLVVVGAPTVDGASRASKTLDWLIAHGHAGQVAKAVIVLSCDRTSKEVDRSRVRSHFEARCRAVVEVPHDPHLATGGRIQLDRLRQPTLDAFLLLAALLADGFGGPVRTAETAVDQVPSLS
jgi:MinD-like ATPase involved in chromosome partitioning or flagellar assembly